MRARKYSRGTPEDRFLARIVKSDGCWEYDGYRYNGYGKFGISPGKTVLAHRFAYEIWVGPIPGGMVLHHLCENKACVRPDHLEPQPKGAHERNHARRRGTVVNQYGQWSVTMTAEEKRIRDRDWMRAKRARIH